MAPKKSIAFPCHAIVFHLGPCRGFMGTELIGRTWMRKREGKDRRRRNRNNGERKERGVDVRRLFRTTFSSGFSQLWVVHSRRSMCRISHDAQKRREKVTDNMLVIQPSLMRTARSYGMMQYKISDRHANVCIGSCTVKHHSMCILWFFPWLIQRITIACPSPLLSN